MPEGPSDLETLCVGRVPGPRLELPEPEKHREGPSMIAPKLTYLRILRQPIHVSLQFLRWLLSHLSHRHLDFDSARTIWFFRANGHLLRSIPTHEIHTSELPYASARVFTVCPNLFTLVFAPCVRGW